MYFKRKVSSTDKMYTCAAILVTSLLLTVSTVKGNGPKFKSSGIYPRSINIPRDRGGGGGGYLGNPAEWTMSKANLVAEFYSTEPAPNSRDRLDRSQKNLFSFLMGNTNNGSSDRNLYVQPQQSTLPQRMAPPPLPPPSSIQGNPGKNRNINLIASGTTYNHQAVPFNEFNGNVNIRPGGYSTPFVPINYPVPQQNFIKFPGSPANGHPPNLRPPNGPLPSPSRQFIWGNRGTVINGLRPPPASPPQQQHQQQQQRQPPPSLYLPPQQQQQQPLPSPAPQQVPQQQPSQAPPPRQQQQQQQYQPPPSLYLPPQQQQQPQPFPRPETQYQPQSPSRPQAPFQPSQQINPNPQSLPKNQVSPQPQQAIQESKNSSTFTPSPLYLPPTRSPENKPSPPESQSGPSPPQILETYSKQSVYPPASSTQPSPEKPLVYVLANSSFDQTSNSNNTNPSTTSQYKFNMNTLNSYTQYENESVPPPPVSSLIASSPPPKQYSPPIPMQQQQYSFPAQQPQQQYSPPAQQQQQQYSPPAQQQQKTPSQQVQMTDLNGIALTEPLSQVLAEANAKAGDAMDKTIRFVIHKPEDEDIVRNAILENAQQRYEDVRFVQGPTLKVQRKETVYLPPKKKTVVYILLKEPQIDTDVEVMSPQEEEPAPEVYITYQKSDGATKTKHYSPKPIRQEDMKKYLDIDEDPYAAGEESRITPRFSKSTSVSLSTSSKISRKTASMSSSVSNSSKNPNNSSSSSLLLNHRMSPLPVDDNGTTDTSHSEVNTSPLLYTSSSELNRFPIITNSTSSVRYPQKKPRSSEVEGISRSPRRFIRQYPIHCPTVK